MASAVCLCVRACVHVRMHACTDISIQICTIIPKSINSVGECLYYIKLCVCVCELICKNTEQCHKLKISCFIKIK